MFYSFKANFFRNFVVKQWHNQKGMGGGVVLSGQTTLLGLFFYFIVSILSGGANLIILKMSSCSPLTFIIIASTILQRDFFSQGSFYKLSLLLLHNRKVQLCVEKTIQDIYVYRFYNYINYTDKFILTYIKKQIATKFQTGLPIN